MPFWGTWCFSAPGLVHKATHQASAEGTATLHIGTASRDGHQACQDAVAQAAHIIFLGDEIPQDEDGDATGGRGQGGVHGHLRRQRSGFSVVHAQGAAGVEAVPAEPQGEGAQDHEGQVVSLEFFGVGEATLARLQDDGAHQTCHSTTEVDDS